MKSTLRPRQATLAWVSSGLFEEFGSFFWGGELGSKVLGEKAIKFFWENRGGYRPKTRIPFEAQVGLVGFLMVCCPPSEFVGEASGWMDGWSE